jgi:solute carrier family 35 protein E1
MPHSTREQSLNPVNFKFPSDTRNPRTSMEKFPDHVDSLDGQPLFQSSPISSSNGFIGGPASEPRWQPRRNSALKGPGWANGSTGGHNRQKSLSDAFRTIRTRRASVSVNVQEVAGALKAPVSPKLIVRETSFQHRNSILINDVGSLHYMVSFQCPYEYILESHPQRLP